MSCYPVFNTHDELVGVLEAINKRGSDGPFTLDDKAQLCIAARLAGRGLDTKFVSLQDRNKMSVMEVAGNVNQMFEHCDKFSVSVRTALRCKRVVCWTSTPSKAISLVAVGVLRARF